MLVIMQLFVNTLFIALFFHFLPTVQNCASAVTMDRFVQNERLACCLLAAGFLGLGQLLQLRQKHNE